MNHVYIYIYICIWFILRGYLTQPEGVRKRPKKDEGLIFPQDMGMKIVDTRTNSRVTNREADHEALKFRCIQTKPFGITEDHSSTWIGSQS